MNTLKAETRCKHLAQYIRPRASYIERFCPSVNQISIRRDDWNLLCKEVSAARAQGFIVNAQGVHYRRFELKPADIPADTSCE